MNTNQSNKFFINLSGEIISGPYQFVQTISVQRSNNLPDQDALISLANAMVSIAQNSNEEIDLNEVFTIAKAINKFN